MFWSFDASAEDVKTDRFEPELSETVQEFPWDSGFIPNSGPLQLMLSANAFNNIAIKSPGDAQYDWDTAEIGFQGDSGAGLLESEIGAEIKATVKIDVFGLDTEFDIGIWDFSEIAQDHFTPYLLPGNPERPAGAATVIGPFNLVNQPFDLVVPGTINIDVAIDVPSLEFAATSIDVAQDESGLVDATIVEESATESLVIEAPAENDTATLYATERGTYSAEIILHLYPTLTVEVFGIEYDIGPFDIQMDYPVVDEQKVVFDPIQLDIAGPRPEEEPEEEPEEDPDDPDDPGTDTGDEPEEEEEEEDTDGPGTSGGLDFDRSDDSGCGCSSNNSNGPAGLIALGLVGMVLTTRRRRR